MLNKPEATTQFHSKLSNGVSWVTSKAISSRIWAAPPSLSRGAPSQIRYHFKLQKEGCITNPVSYLMIKDALSFLMERSLQSVMVPCTLHHMEMLFKFVKVTVFLRKKYFLQLKVMLITDSDLTHFILTLNIYNQDIFKFQFKIMRRFYGHGLDWKLLCSYIQYWHCNILPPRSDYEAHKK